LHDLPQHAAARRLGAAAACRGRRASAGDGVPPPFLSLLDSRCPSRLQSEQSWGSQSAPCRSILKPPAVNGSQCCGRALCRDGHAGSDACQM
jgi:hypothetical protein